MLSIGPAEIMLILALALIFLGPERLPEVARQVGKVVGQIRRTTDELKRTLDAEIRDDERARRLTEYRERQEAIKAKRAAEPPDPLAPAPLAPGISAPEALDDQLAITDPDLAPVTDPARAPVSAPDEGSP